MMLGPLPPGSEGLRALLRDFLSRRLETAEFCRAIEVGYNDAVDDKAMGPAEQPIWKRLFDVAAWFSPLPEERSEVPHLRDEQQVWHAALTAKAELQGLD